MSATVKHNQLLLLRDLLERLVVDKACRIFRDVQLAFLELFAKLPTVRPITSGFDVCMMVADSRETLDQRHDRVKDIGQADIGPTYSRVVLEDGKPR